jgi:hypothetical protein
MTAPSPITIEARIDPAEQAALIAGAEQLSEHLSIAIGGPSWPVRLNLTPPGAPLAEGPAPHVIVTSMLPETQRLSDPMPVVEARWRAALERLTASGAAVLVCTVFRHLAERPKDGAASPLLERVRRLNRLAVELSNAFGVGVIDFDRDLTHIGGRALRSDYRLTGVLAAEVAGHAVAWALLSVGLDAVVDPEVQEKAKAALGDMRGIDALINRRLARRRAAGQAVPGDADHG